MITIAWAVIAIIGMAITLFVKRHSLDAVKTLQIVLLWYFGILVGAQGLVITGYHFFDAAATARMIGWAPGSPFQFENAMGDFAFAVLGLLSLRFRGLFWLATTIGWSISWLGDAYGHIYQIVVNHDYAPYNTGALLAGDIAFPIILIILLVAYYLAVKARAAKSPEAIDGQASVAVP
ncbi:MAG: DUF6790 family protein [Candidatus Dormibacteraceae bacterium]